MKLIIKQDIKQIISSFRFWAILGLIISITALNIFLKYDWHISPKQLPNAWDLFIIGNINGNTFMLFLAPFIPSLVCGLIIIDDINAVTFRKRVNICGLKKYVYARAISSTIMGGGIFFLAFIIILLGCIIFGSSDLTYVYNPLGLFKEVYYTSVPLYILLFILHSMIFGAIYALFGMGIAITTKSNSMALVLPGIVYNCFRLIGIIFDQTVIYKIQLIFPFLTYEFGSLDMPLWENIADLLIILIVSLILIIIGYNNLKKTINYENSEALI